MLNIPTELLDIIRTKKNILLSGMGGGFDIYGALPLYYTLEKLGKNVVLANYSFSDFKTCIEQGNAEVISNNLIRSVSNFEVGIDYYPEGYLSKFFNIGFQKEVPVYMFAKTGTNPLTQSYQYIIDRHEIDLIILIDGGVDSLNTGFETGHGTVVEDSITVASLSQFQNIEKTIMCIGFGTEVEEKVCGYNVLMNMSNIVKNNGFLGSCSLVKNSNSFLFYKNACMYAFNCQNLNRTSHIHRRIIPAIEGEFGDYHMTDEDLGTDIFISPFMSICWFFKYDAIFIYNKLLPYVGDSETFFDVVQRVMPIINAEKVKIPHNIIPY